MSHLARMQTLPALKGTAKGHAVDLMRLNTLRGNKTTCLPPKRYDEPLHSSYMGVPPGSIAEM